MKTFLHNFFLKGLTAGAPEDTNPMTLKIKVSHGQERSEVVDGKNGSLLPSHVAALTHCGLVRDLNEDYILSDCERDLYIVADGVGGANAGDIASQEASAFCLDRFASGFDQGLLELGSAKELMSGVLVAANVHICEMAENHSEMHGMGCALVAARISQSTVSIVHVGDVRAYRLQKKGGLEQLTEDHSMVWNEYRAGRLTKEEARLHPHKNRITRAIGMPGTMLVDFNMVDLESGDILLLCSDGLWDMLSDDEIEALLRLPETAGKLAQKLVAAANQAGGKDNISVVVWVHP